MIKKSVFVLMVCGFLLTGCSTTGEKSMETMDYSELGGTMSTLTVQNMEGQAVALELIWENRRVVLVFLRHFG